MGTRQRSSRSHPPLRGFPLLQHNPFQGLHYPRSLSSLSVAFFSSLCIWFSHALKNCYLYFIFSRTLFNAISDHWNNLSAIYSHFTFVKSPVVLSRFFFLLMLISPPFSGAQRYRLWYSVLFSCLLTSLRLYQLFASILSLPEIRKFVSAALANGC